MHTCSGTVVVSVFIKEKFSSRQFRNFVCNISISINDSIYKPVALLVMRPLSQNFIHDHFYFASLL